MLKCIPLAAFVLSSACHNAAATQESAPAGDKTAASGQTAALSWSAFECATFADLSGDTSAQARLFELGYNSGKRFLEAAKRNETKESDLRKNAPIGFLDNTAGPTVDFALGRIYEVASGEAFDRIVKHDQSGMPLPVGKWTMDRDLRKSLAEAELRNQNCALLK